MLKGDEVFIVEVGDTLCLAWLERAICHGEIVVRLW